MTSPSANPTAQTPTAPAADRLLKMSLLRNELRWALPLCGLGILILLATQLSDGLDDAWIPFADEWPMFTVSFFAFAAPILAAVTTLADELTRTREYLLHRPVPPRRLFWTRHLVGLAVLVAIMVLAPALHLLLARLFGENTEFVDYRLFPARVAHGLPAFGIYAMAVFGLTCARSLWGSALLGLAAVTLMGSLAALAILMPGGIWLAYGLSLFGTPLLLEAAYRCQREGRDADRPWETKRLVLAAPMLLLVTGLIGAASFSVLHFWGTWGLYDHYPGVSLDEGRYVLADWSGDDRAYMERNEQHRFTGRALPGEPPHVFSANHGPWDRLEGGYESFDTFPRYGRWVGGKLVATSYGGGRWRRTYFSSDGHVYIYREAGRGRHAQLPGGLRKLGKGPEGRPFSPQAEVVSNHYERLALINDPDDGGLWAYDLQSDAPGFVQQTLPGNDRFRNVESARRFTPTTNYLGTVPFIVEGDRGRYLLDDGEWKPVPPELTTAQRKNPWLKRRMEFHSARSFTLTLTRRDTGATVFQHHYQPHRRWEKLLALAVEAPTLLRSPLTTIASLFREQKHAYRMGPTLLLDPAVTMGSRGTVVGNVLICLVLGGFCFFRLRRLGVGGGRRAFWTAAVVLGGLPAYLCYRLVETDRAWKPLPAATPARAALARLLLA